MGRYYSTPTSFVAATKARASEVNTNFTEVSNAFRAGTHDVYLNGLILNRLSNGNVSVTANGAYLGAYTTIDTNATYTLTDSTSRMAVLGMLTINAGGFLILTSGAEVVVTP